MLTALILAAGVLLICLMLGGVIGLAVDDLAYGFAVGVGAWVFILLLAAVLTGTSFLLDVVS